MLHIKKSPAVFETLSLDVFTNKTMINIRLYLTLSFKNVSHVAMEFYIWLPICL